MEEKLDGVPEHSVLMAIYRGLSTTGIELKASNIDNKKHKTGQIRVYISQLNICFKQN